MESESIFEAAEADECLAKTKQKESVGTYAIVQPSTEFNGREFRRERKVSRSRQ